MFRWYEEVQRIDQSAGDDTRRATLEHCRAELARIEDDAREVHVPLGYAHELYSLRLHIDLLGQQIERRLGSPLPGDDPAGPDRLSADGSPRGGSVPAPPR